jgi:outer membrane protein
MRYAFLLLSLAVSSCHAAEVLTLERAIELATADNRTLRNTELDIRKAAAEAAARRTQLYPSFKLNLLGSQLLTPIDFTLQRGLLGNFPNAGPIPANDTPIHTPLRPTGLFYATVTQPLLSSFHRIRLNLKLLDLNSQLAREQARAGLQDTVRDVKRLYYSIQQSQSGLRAADETVALYRETESLTGRYLAEQTVLKGYHLDAQTRLARAEQSRLSLQDQIDTSKEQLNLLLGRDVLTAFDTAPALEAGDLDADVEAARRRALAQRSELREAKLKLEQAEQDRRVKKAEYIPDMAATFTSIDVIGFNTFVPLHFTSAGLSVSWEPFDWGRKRHELVEKDAMIGQARNTAADAESRVLVDVNDKFRKLRQTGAQLRVARLEQQTAMENLRVTQDKFKQQSSLRRDVLAAQVSLEQANLDYNQALASYWTARADFERATGENQ